MTSTSPQVSARLGPAMAAGTLHTALCVAMATTMLPKGSARTTRIPAFAGPYIAYPDKFYKCPPPANGHIRDCHILMRQHTHYNPAKPFESPVLSAFVNSSKAFDDTWWAHVDVAIWSNNQWKEHAFVMKFPNVGCSALRTNMPVVFRALFKRLGASVMKKNAPCVVPAGGYSFDPQPIEWLFPNVPVFPYGRYRMTIMFGFSGETQDDGCAMIECHVVPKPR